ncbi:MAG TPA: twin-arginine translocase subunit TatC [Acidiferrobacteraceae bacterium]|nr:twin-arginine translocase subunit TatC [Acidiferrobacteraceae bacterium]
MAQENNAEGSFISHLLELRDRLVKSVITVAVVFVPFAFFSKDLYLFIAEPLKAVLPGAGEMISTGVVSPFFTPIKLAIWSAVILSMPVLLYQLWAFVAPGLYKHERRIASPLLISSVLLFYLGMAFAYFVVFPLVFTFFTQVTPEGIKYMPDIKDYLDFVISIVFAFGLAFEVPVAIVLLTKAGMVNPDNLAKKRHYVVLWIFVIAMLMTPPDVISQTLLAIPMMLLFEVGLFFARRIKSRDENAEEDEFQELSDEEMDVEFDRFNGETDKKNAKD